MATSKATALTTAPEATINLIVRKGAQEKRDTHCAHRNDTVLIDVTDAILSKVENFGYDSIAGFSLDAVEEPPIAMREPFFRIDELWGLGEEIQKILDASIVNQKQREAVSSLIDDKITDLYNKGYGFIEESVLGVEYTPTFPFGRVKGHLHGLAEIEKKDES